MRKRYDATGKCIGAHNLVFDEIPDDYVIKKKKMESDSEADAC